MYQTSVDIRVRYAETDQMGYVYYGNYAMYYEVARVESLRQLGFSYKELEAHGIMMPVIESCSKYLKPGRYDELLTIEVQIPKLPTARIFFEYTVKNEVGEIINTGETTLVFIDIATGKPTRAPESLLSIMGSYFPEY